MLHPLAHSPCQTIGNIENKAEIAHLACGKLAVNAFKLYKLIENSGSFTIILNMWFVKLRIMLMVVIVTRLSIKSVTMLVW